MSQKTPIVEYFHANPTTDEEGHERWWAVDPKDAYKTLFAYVHRLETDQSQRNTLNLRYAKMYSNLDALGISPENYNRYNLSGNGSITFNVTKSCVDTVVSKIAKNKPKPQVLTQKGNFSLQTKAKYLTQLLEGQFEELDVYNKAQNAFRDGAVFGTGGLKFYIDPAKQKVQCKRVFIDQIFVDDLAGFSGTPYDLVERSYYPKSVLAEMYPKYKDDIKSATEAHKEHTNAEPYIEVLEGWRLPNGKQKGVHIVAIDNKTLCAKEYKRSKFPFVWTRWSDKIAGFFGCGLAEELVSIQAEINRTLKAIRAAQELAAVPRVFIDAASNVDISQINNRIGGIVKYQGAPPTIQTSQGMTQEVYAWVENMYSKAYEITGVSRMSANSQKPPGLNSAIALNTYQDIESERFMLTGQRYEQMIMEGAHLLIDFNKELYSQEDAEDHVVKATTNKFIKTIKWSEVDMDEDQYSMTIFPVNALPSTPAGKLQTVQELVKAGMMEQEQAISLLDFPDLEGAFSLMTAPKENIERMLEAIIEDGDTEMTPEPYMNLELALTMTQYTYLRMKCEKLSEERLELLRNFMEQIQTLLNPQPTPSEQAAAAMAGPPQPQLGPVATGGAPPPADLAPMTGSPLPPPMPLQ